MTQRSSRHLLIQQVLKFKLKKKKFVLGWGFSVGDICFLESDYHSDSLDFKEPLVPLIGFLPYLEPKLD